MSNYVASIWKCRYFWMSLVRMDLRTRYRRSALGMGWSLLQPLVMSTVLCLVFHRIFQLDIRTYGPSVLMGMCFWSFVTAVTSQGCQCLFQGEPYIRQYPAPIAIYPLRAVLGASIHFLMALCVVLVLTWILNGFSNLPVLISLLPAMLLMFALGWSVAILVGFANAYFPDTQHFSEVGLQMLFYSTPIIYPAEMLRAKGLGWIVDYNPLAALLELFRVPLLEARFPSASAYGVTSLVVFVVMLAAILTLTRLQRKIIFQL